MQPKLYKKQPKVGSSQLVEFIKLLSKEGKNMNNNLSDNLKKIRKDNKLSQEQLAEELGVSRQAISKWESGLAYPEMDKIIQLCNKFNLNIDDLLNRDIREIKSEEISKNNINKIINSFLNFITDTVNLFYNMNFISKLKCIFEQFINIIIILLIYIISEYCLMNILGGIFRHLPSNIYYVIIDILKSLYIIFYIIISLGIIIHIFKKRYLDYYKKIKKESTIKDDSIDITNEKEKIDNNNVIKYKQNENKIIIRDKEDTEYNFINLIFKTFIFGVKIFAILFLLVLCMSLISLVICFIASFIVYKTGLFFVGLLLSFLSSSIINMILILLLLNFIFNRKNDKKKIIWSFIGSLITLGIGIGLIFVGSLKFNYVRIDKNSEELKTSTFEVEMDDKLSIYSYNNIEYIEKDIDNIEIEVKTNKLMEVETNTYNNELLFYSYCKDSKTIVDSIIKNLNNYKIEKLNNEIYSIKVYTSTENINKLKENYRNNY